MSRNKSDRNPSEEAARGLEKGYSSLVRLSPDGMVLLKGKRIVFANRRAAEMFGVDESDLLGADIEQLLSGSLESTLRQMSKFERQAVLEVLGKARLGAVGSTVNIQYEIPVRRRSGETTWIEVNANSFEQDGELVGLAILRDSTARKRAESALRTTEQYYRQLIENAPDGFIVLNQDGSLRTASSSCERIFGYTLSELVHSSFFSYVHPDDAKKIMDLFNQLLRSPGAAVPGGVRCLRRDGSWCYIECVGTNFTHDPAIGGVIINIRDVTDRKRAEEKLARYTEDLVRSNAELEQFAYIASHDLREPLRMVRIYVQFLAKAYKGNLDSDADEFIGYIVDGVDRMDALVDGLRAYAHVCASGKEFESVDCEVVLERVLNSLRTAIEESGAAVTHGPVPKWVIGNSSQLLLLFRHLIDNAIKFRGVEPPRIHISAEEKDGEWLFSVQDNGIGIDAEHAERIFFIFNHVHARDEYPGTGVGLALCKKIVELHDGRIWVESQIDHGSTFHFTIPVSRDSEHEKEDGAKADRATSSVTFALP